ncbi:MAG TPA: ribokinase [Firmicutes bacterium]|nr:ribokinase [Bacillota bacterium]
MSIVVVGSLNMDYVMQVDELPRVGETVFSTRYTSAPGGKGANQAAAAARLGASVKMLGCTGNDAAGRALLESLKGVGVDVSAVHFEPSQPTGSAFITVSASGANTIVVHRGANFALSPEHLKEHESLIAQANVLVTQLEIPLEAVLSALKIARRHHVVTVLNPAPSVPLPLEALELTDYLVPNETEAISLLSRLPKEGHGGSESGASGAPDLSDLSDPRRAGAVAASLAKATRGTVVITLGENGCVASTASTTGRASGAITAGAFLTSLATEGVTQAQAFSEAQAERGSAKARPGACKPCDGEEYIALPAFKVKAVDTTAAGDAFVGALAYKIDRARAQGGTGIEAFNLEDALRFASAAGAIATTKVGAQPSLPTLSEVAELMRTRTN